MADKLSRRDLFGMFRRSLDAAREPPLPVPLRPPGALAEKELAETCLRCNACVDVCPRRAIRPLGAAYGERAGTPHITARDAPCVLCDGLLCTTHCPSGALRPLERPEEVRMGRAEVVPRRCLAHQGQPCSVCVERCPIPGALIQDEKGLPQVTSACTGCGLCEYYCPTDKAAAIVVKPLAALLSKPSAARGAP